MSNRSEADALATTTTSVKVGASSAPVSGQVLTATSSTAATWQTQTLAQVKGSTAGSIPFVGAAPGLLLTENNGKLNWDNTNFRLGVGGTASRTLHVLGSTNSGTDTVAPNICVENTYVSTGGISDFSFSSFQMRANGGALNGQFFADGSGYFIGAPSIYFRATSNHALAFGTNSVVRMVLTAGGNLGVGTAAADALCQVGAKSFLDQYSTTRTAIHGANIQSETLESLLRLQRNTDQALYYPGVVDFMVGAYQAGGSGNGYNPATKMVVRMKTVASFLVTPTVDVLDLRANGQVRVPGTMTIGSTANPTAKLLLAASTTAANTGAIKFTSGPAPSTPEAGIINFEGDVWKVGITTGPAYKTLAFTSDLTASNITNTATGRIAQTNVQSALNEVADMLIRDRGTWSNATTYVMNDMVLHNGGSYVCTAGHTNQEPYNSAYWRMLGVGRMGMTSITHTDFPYTIGPGVQCLLIDLSAATTGTTYTATLPTLTSSQGRLIRVVRTDNNGDFTIQCQVQGSGGTEQIDFWGSTTQNMSTRSTRDFFGIPNMWLPKN